jgi:hypothetical protein
MTIFHYQQEAGNKRKDDRKIKRAEPNNKEVRYTSCQASMP